MLSTPKEAVVVEDSKVTRKLLLKLQEIEKSLEYGSSKLVQPAFPGVVDPITVEGYGPEQIDFHLKLFVVRHLVETGITGGSPQIGIYFSRLTEAGRHGALGLNS